MGVMDSSAGSGRGGGWVVVAGAVEVGWSGWFGGGGRGEGRWCIFV